MIITNKRQANTGTHNFTLLLSSLMIVSLNLQVLEMKRCVIHTNTYDSKRVANNEERITSLGTESNGTACVFRGTVHITLGVSWIQVLIQIAPVPIALIFYKTVFVKQHCISIVFSMSGNVFQSRNFCFCHQLLTRVSFCLEILNDYLLRTIYITL